MSRKCIQHLHTQLKSLFVTERQLGQVLLMPVHFCIVSDHNYVHDMHECACVKTRTLITHPLMHAFPGGRFDTQGEQNGLHCEQREDRVPDPGKGSHQQDLQGGDQQGDANQETAHEVHI